MAEASQRHVHYNTAGEERQEMGDGIWAACYVFAPSKPTWPPTRVFLSTLSLLLMKDEIYDLRGIPMATVVAESDSQ